MGGWQQELSAFHNCANRRRPVPPARTARTAAVGDTIPIAYNNRKYFIDIVEARPGDAISVIETDCNVRRHRWLRAVA